MYRCWGRSVVKSLNNTAISMCLKFFSSMAITILLCLSSITLAISPKPTSHLWFTIKPMGIDKVLWALHTLTLYIESVIQRTLYKQLGNHTLEFLINMDQISHQSAWWASKDIFSKAKRGRYSALLSGITQLQKYQLAALTLSPSPSCARPVSSARVRVYNITQLSTAANLYAI